MKREVFFSKPAATRSAPFNKPLFPTLSCTHNFHITGRQAKNLAFRLFWSRQSYLPFRHPPVIASKAAFRHPPVIASKAKQSSGPRRWRASQRAICFWGEERENDATRWARAFDSGRTL